MACLLESAWATNCLWATRYCECYTQWGWSRQGPSLVAHPRRTALERQGTMDPMSKERRRLESRVAATPIMTTSRAKHGAES